MGGLLLIPIINHPLIIHSSYINQSPLLLFDPRYSTLLLLFGAWKNRPAGQPGTGLSDSNSAARPERHLGRTLIHRPWAIHGPYMALLPRDPWSGWKIYSLPQETMVFAIRYGCPSKEESCMSLSYQMPLVLRVAAGFFMTSTSGMSWNSHPFTYTWPKFRARAQLTHWLITWAKIKHIQKSPL